MTGLGVDQQVISMFLDALRTHDPVVPSDLSDELSAHLATGGPNVATVVDMITRLSGDTTRMIKITKLVITEFRGVRSLTLDLSNQSFLIHGPNGTGKSGIVDAIDFALTGSVARLTGSGTGGISVLRHAPHVTHRDNASEARVELTFRDVASGSSATLTRCVRTAKTYTLAPDTPQLRAVLAEVAGHPEMILTRREVLKFVLAEPGKRSDEVQALLKLDRLGALRKTLKTASSQLNKEHSQAVTAAASAARELSTNLGRDQVLNDEFLDAINQRRTILGAVSIGALDEHTDVRSGVELPRDAGPSPSLILRTVDEAVAAADRLAAPNTFKLVERLNRSRHILHAAAATATSAQIGQLTRAGLNLATGETCPLCDTVWEAPEALRAHLAAKLERFSGVQSAQEAATSAFAELDQLAVDLMTKVRTVVKQCEALGTATSELRAVLTNWHGQLATLRAELSQDSTSAHFGTSRLESASPSQ